jgi:hypothetical protein
MWCGSDCRDLVFHAIEPLDKMGKVRCGIALHVLDLTRKFGDRAVRGVHSLDVGFENADVLGHFLRRAEHLGTPNQGSADEIRHRASEGAILPMGLSYFGSVGSSSVKRSAGILMIRLSGRKPMVLLVHPGGPFWRR